jgi:hypothetical protein
MRSDDRSKVDRRELHKPNVCPGRLRTSLVSHRDKPFLIFRPDLVLFNCALNGAGFVRSFDQPDQRCRQGAYLSPGIEAAVPQPAAAE